MGIPVATALGRRDRFWPAVLVSAALHVALAAWGISRRPSAVETGIAIYRFASRASRSLSGIGFVIMPTFTMPARCTVAMTSTMKPYGSALSA